MDRWDPWGLDSNGTSETEVERDPTAETAQNLRDLGDVLVKIFAEVAIEVLRFSKSVKQAKSDFANFLKGAMGAEPDPGKPTSYPDLFLGLGAEVVAGSIPTFGAEAPADIESALTNTKQSYDSFSQGDNLNGLEKGALAAGDVGGLVLSAIGFGGLSRMGRVGKATQRHPGGIGRNRNGGGGGGKGGGGKGDGFSALIDASTRAKVAATRIREWIPKNKHMMGGAGSKNRFNTDSEDSVRDLIRSALNSPDAIFLPNPGIQDSFKVVFNAGRQVGIKPSHHSVRIIVVDSVVVNAFPVRIQ